MLDAIYKASCIWLLLVGVIGCVIAIAVSEIWLMNKIYYTLRTRMNDDVASGIAGAVALYTVCILFSFIFKCPW